MFDYFISLGSACPLASSMSKYGLRSFSSPFDWLATPNLEWVIHYIETDFKDFLLQKNLERYDENPRHFRDKESGFRFVHEDEDFENNYYALKEKYDRRIDRFLKNVHYKVCYFRRITKDDIEYIDNNAEYIRKVIKKHNPHSEIVFLYDSTIPFPDNFEFLHYKMSEEWSCASRYSLRSYFDHANDFLDYCGKNYSGLNLIRNLSFDIVKEDAINAINARRYKTLTTLLTHDFNNSIIPNHIIIYGAGVIGKELYKQIKKYTKIKCFVDKQKAGSEFDNIKIISVDELIYEKGVKIIVSATYDFKNIRNELLNIFENDDIISLDTILNLKF